MHGLRKGLWNGNRYRETATYSSAEFADVNCQSLPTELWCDPWSGATRAKPSLAPSRASSFVVTLTSFCPLILPCVPSWFMLFELHYLLLWNRINVLITEASPAHQLQFLKGKLTDVHFIPAALALSDLCPIWEIFENAEGTILPQWGYSVGRCPLKMHFLPRCGSQGFTRPACFRQVKKSFQTKTFPLLTKPRAAFCVEFPNPDAGVPGRKNPLGDGHAMQYTDPVSQQAWNLDNLINQCPPPVNLI